MKKEIKKRKIHKVDKGWGWEEWFFNEPDLYCGKALYFYPGRKCSYHYHRDKHETFLVMSGWFNVRLGDDDDISNSQLIKLWKSESIVIEPGIRHQMTNVSNELGCIIEFSTFHKDEDSYRIIKGD